jgi:ATP-binding cassette subfamily A (ABC1) protein 12
MLITRFEEETKGLHWDNIDRVVASDTVSFVWMCYMMLIDSAIYLVLGWYIRGIKPGGWNVFSAL